MKIERPNKAVSLLAVALVPVAGPAWPAAQPCAACEAVPSLDWTLDLSGGYISDDSFKFGDYTGLNSDGAVGIIDADAAYRDAEGVEWRVEARDLGLDSRSLELGVRRPGWIDVQLDYDALPHLLFEGVETPFDRPGGAAQMLPADWVHSATTAGMLALAENLRPADVRTDRETFGVGLIATPDSRWRYDLAVRLGEKKGTALGGSTFLFQDTILVQPVDLQTRIFEAGAAYTAPDWGARLGYYGSLLVNQDLSLSWDNPYALRPLQGARALEPENEFHQLQLSGNWRHGRVASLMANVALGRGYQDQKLLPFTTVVGRGGLLPRSSADAGVDTLQGTVRLVVNPVPRLRIQADWLRDDRDSETPVADWDYVITDVANGMARPNLAYDVSRERWRAEAEWRAGAGIRAAAGWSSQEMDRDYREVPETVEDGYWLRVVAPLASVGSVRLRWRSLSRDPRGASERPAFLVSENPLLARADVSKRDRTGLEATLGLQPAAWLDLALSGEKGRDDYDGTVVGLQRADYERLSADGTLRLGESAHLTAFVSREESDTVQGGSGSAPLGSWPADQDDETDLAGLNLDVTLVPDRLTANVAFTRVTTGSLITMGLDADTDSFPDLDTDLDRTEVSLRWTASRALRLRLAYTREDYAVDDWALDGVAVDTLPQVLSVGATRPDYDVNVVLLSFEYGVAGR